MRLWFVILPLAGAAVTVNNNNNNNNNNNQGILSHCVYFCKTPRGQFFCCDSGDNGSGPPVVHPGRCPPLRPQCPDTRQRSLPTSCAHDGQCPYRSKCCYDACLRWTVCKPAQFGGGTG